MNLSDDVKRAGDPTKENPKEYYPSLHWSAGQGWSSIRECVATEAPLAIEIGYERLGQRVNKLLTVTMRTPGDDEALALGFLLSEGLIRKPTDIGGSVAAGQNSSGEQIATWRVELAQAPETDLRRVSRELVTSSACGLCGRKTLAGLPLGAAAATGDMVQSCESILVLPEILRRHQLTFAETGGVHGAALFDRVGSALLVREDVGRHNAVDKLLGRSFLTGISPAGKVLALSGRVSFELMQKAAAAGVEMVVAVGAPSSLAIDLAHYAGITLVGFVRDGRFNVYTHANRLSPRGARELSIDPS